MNPQAIAITLAGLALVLSGCISGEPLVGQSESDLHQVSSEEEFVYGTFVQGLVYFAFTASGPDHRVGAYLENETLGAMIMMDRYGTILAANHHLLSIHGEKTGDHEMFLMRTGPDGTSWLSISMYEPYWHQPLWIVFAAADSTGPVPIRVFSNGTQLEINTPFTEAPSRLFTPDEWNGILEARVGEAMNGIHATVARTVEWETHNGTFAVYRPGSMSGARTERYRLENSTGTTTIGGFGAFGIAQFEEPGVDRIDAGFNLLGAPDSWRLTVERRVQSNGYEDALLVSDVRVPFEQFM